jgi:DNA-binding IclR family transcriptional regulator
MPGTVDCPDVLVQKCRHGDGGEESMKPEDAKGPSQRRVLTGSGSVRAVDRATDVLFCLSARKAPMGPAEIARIVGLDRATVHRLLQTLLARDLVVQARGSGRYMLGPGLLRLSEAIPGSELRQMAAPYIRQLRDYSNETVALGVTLQNRCIQILQEPSPQTIHWNAVTGESLPLYSGATGKAILAFLNPTQQAAALAEANPVADGGNPVANGGNPVANGGDDRGDRQEAQRDIPLIRRRGYATATQETAADVKGLAAPIFDRLGKPIAAITIGWPASRYTQDALEASTSHLLEAANGLSSRLGYNVKRVVRRLR